MELRLLALYRVNLPRAPKSLLETGPRAEVRHQRSAFVPAIGTRLRRPPNNVKHFTKCQTVIIRRPWISEIRVPRRPVRSASRSADLVRPRATIEVFLPSRGHPCVFRPGSCRLFWPLSSRSASRCPPSRRRRSPTASSFPAPEHHYAQIEVTFPNLPRRHARGAHEPVVTGTIRAARVRRRTCSSCRRSTARARRSPRRGRVPTNGTSPVTTAPSASSTRSTAITSTAPISRSIRRTRT